MGKFEIWLRDTLAKAEEFLAEAEADKDTSAEAHAEFEYWRGRRNALRAVWDRYQAEND